MVLGNMPLAELATLHGVAVRMMEVAATGVQERSFRSVVEEIDGCAMVTWTKGGMTLTAQHEVECFVASDDMEALHIVMEDGKRRMTIVEPRRTDGSNLVGRSEDPRACVLATLADIRASLAACAPSHDGWGRPKTQADHLIDASLQEAIATSVPDHVDAVVTMSEQDVAMFVNIVMPSPYGPARYDGSEVFARSPRRLDRAVAKASPLLPRCIMATRTRNNPSSHAKWQVSAYRTGLEMLESTGGPMERLRVLARLEGVSGPER